MKLRTPIVLVLLAILPGCGGPAPAAPKGPTIAVLPPPSEWFPSLVPPTALADTERVSLLKACGVAEAAVVWIQYVDLDGDRCNDAIVTLSLPGRQEDKVQKWVTISYVFIGKNEGAFRQTFVPGDIWFALVTDMATSSAEGDIQTRRQFAMRRLTSQQGGDFAVTLNDCSYASDGATRFLQFRGSTTKIVKVGELPRDRALPLEHGGS